MPRQPMLYIGIDLGGTKIRAAIAEYDQAPIAEITEPTSKANGDGIANQLTRIVKALLSQINAELLDLEAIGVGSPGIVNFDGTIQLASNLPGFDRMPLARVLTQATNTQVTIENDANAAALGEGLYGAALGCGNYAVMSLGTGAGLGIITDGRILRGSRGAAGEVAFLPIGGDPTLETSRTSGTFETSCSGPALQTLARSLRRDAPTSNLPLHPNMTDVLDMPSDSVSQAVIAHLSTNVAKAILCIACVVDPELIILAGGIGARPELLEPIQTQAAKVLPFPVRIETSSLGIRSGVLGALAIAFGKSQTSPQPTGSAT